MEEYLILSAKSDVAKNNSPYCKLRCVNDERTIIVNIWATPVDKTPKVNEVIRFLSPLKEKDDFISTEFTNCRVTKCDINHKLFKYVQAPPSIQEWNELLSKIKKNIDEDIYNSFIDDKLSKLYSLYVKYPAATSNHHTYPGGLLTHTYQMLNILLGIKSTYPFKFHFPTVVIGIMLHDFGKTVEYQSDGVRTPEFYLLGHIYIGAKTAAKLMTSHGFTPKQIEYVEHCVLAHHSKKEWGSPVVPATIEAFITHHCDMLSGIGDMYDKAGDMENVFGLGVVVKQDN